MTAPSFKPGEIWHKGEIAVQERTASRAIVERYATRMIRPYMPDQHRRFFESLPFIVMGLLDKDGRPWATLSAGAPGFIQSPDEFTLEITSSPILAEELALQLGISQKIGLLGLELPTRRRNRMNGAVSALNGDKISVHVDQSFGNCPKYIQTRDIKLHKPQTAGKPVRENGLSATVKAVIEGCDTFFIASRTAQLDGDPRSGIDVSHRGGRPGFVRVLDNNRLEFPDFTGNRIFNTFGNIEDDGRVGIIFTDFDTADAVFITGNAKVIWNKARIEQFPGAERLVEVTAQEAIFAPASLPISGPLTETSPLLNDTGPWQDAK